jgi:hypothetical protein
MLNMNGINSRSKASLKLGKDLRVESLCRTFTKSMENSDHQRNEQLPLSNKSSSLTPEFRHFPGESHQLTSQRNMLHTRLQSEPVLQVSSPSTPRRLNSEPLSAIPKSSTSPGDLLHLQVPNSRRQHSGPTLSSSTFSRLPFQNKETKESLQDNGYIFPISDPQEELPLHHFQMTEQTDDNNVIFVVGNPKKHVHVYSC